MKVDWLDYVFITAIGGYAIASPYTKVEESFNIQAIHDITYSLPLEKFDHIEFPGAVPRSFIGALLLGLALKPLHWYMAFDSKFDLQLLARGTLGLVNGFALIHVRHTLADKACNNKRDAKIVGYLFMLFNLVQFHLVYYSSRTLPNMFALPLTNFAIASTLVGNYPIAIALLSFAAIVFRAEIIILAGSLGLTLLAMKKVSLPVVFKSGIFGFGVGAGLSAFLDSFYWRHFPMIPEIFTIVFNVIHGKSELWGVEPFHTYFTRHIPNMMTNPTLLGLVPIGLFEDPTRVHALRTLAIASFIFVAVYSFQPHKEWRFVVYIMPVLSLLAANGTLVSYNHRAKALAYKVILGVVALTTVASFGVSLAKLATSSLNYPGGEALKQFNSLVTEDPRFAECNLTVHMDIPACMTGVTRFGQIHDSIIYDKTETTEKLEQVWTSFDYLITANGEASAFPSVSGFEWRPVAAVEAFDGLSTDILEEVMNSYSDENYYWSLIDKLRASGGFKEAGQQLWKRIVRTAPKSFIYKRVCVGNNCGQCDVTE